MLVVAPALGRLRTISLRLRLTLWYGALVLLEVYGTKTEPPTVVLVVYGTLAVLLGILGWRISATTDKTS